MPGKLRGHSKGMARYSQCPRGVLKVVFHSCPSPMCTRLQAFLRSILVKNDTPCSCSNAVDMRGSRSQFLMVMVFRPLYLGSRRLSDHCSHFYTFKFLINMFNDSSHNMRGLCHPSVKSSATPSPQMTSVMNIKYNQYHSDHVNKNFAKFVAVFVVLGCMTLHRYSLMRRSVSRYDSTDGRFTHRLISI